MTTDVRPDPGMIGGVTKAPFAFLPKPARVFETRATRFAFLAGTSRLGPYLTFLAELCELQARLALSLPPVEPISESQRRAARVGAMPPIDRNALPGDPALHHTLTEICAGAQALDMPEPARIALNAVSAAPETDRQWLLANILADTVPEDSAAPHIFVAAAVQVHLARLAAGLSADGLVKVRTGTCPACGGRPVLSSVTGAPDIENVRYATCAGCATQWNEVRITCLCCGSNKGISYRSVETTEATVKAEVCAECDSWVKIFYQVKNAGLDPFADDVGSIGLDMLMKDTAFARGGFNPFLTGY